MRPFKHRLPFPRSEDEAIWESWRVKLRRALHEVFALDRLGGAPTPEPEVIESEDCGAYLLQCLKYETLPGNWVRAFLLVPRSGPARKPAVLCPHGHVAGAAESTIKPELACGVAYGHELARRGMVVLSPDNAGNGARKDAADSSEHGCDLLWRRLNHVGLDLTGLRVFELMAAVNLLEKHESVCSDRIGVAGLSGGCWLSQVLAALDGRLRAIVLSGYFSTFEQTAWVGHCVCHHPKGIGEICEMYDIAALIAPRPVFIESGIEDLHYPVEPAFSKTREAYRLLGTEDNLQLDRYKGGHLFYGKNSIPWLVEQLSK